MEQATGGDGATKDDGDEPEAGAEEGEGEEQDEDEDPGVQANGSDGMKVDAPEVRPQNVLRPVGLLSGASNVGGGECSPGRVLMDDGWQWGNVQPLGRHWHECVGPKQDADGTASSSDNPHSEKDNPGAYVLGFSREHMKAWRQLPAQRYKEYTGDIKKQEGAKPGDPILATWPDGFKASIWKLTCAEFGAIEATDKVCAKGTPIWETRPTENQRIWVSRPTEKNNMFYIHQKIDGVQRQMLQIKATSYGESDEQINEAKKLAVQLAQKLAFTKGMTKDTLRELRDEAVPTPVKVNKRPACLPYDEVAPKKQKAAKIPGTAKATAPKQAEASELDTAGAAGSKSAAVAEPAAAKSKGSEADELGAPSAKEPSHEKAASWRERKLECGFCGAEPQNTDIYSTYNFCEACFED